MYVIAKSESDKLTCTEEFRTADHVGNGFGVYGVGGEEQGADDGFNAVFAFLIVPTKHCALAEPQKTNADCNMQCNIDKMIREWIKLGQHVVEAQSQNSERSV